MTTHKVQIKNEEEENYKDTAMSAAAQSTRFIDMMSGFDAVSPIRSKGVSGVGPSGGHMSDSSPAPSLASISHPSASGVGDLRTVSELEEKVKEMMTTFCEDLKLSEDVAKSLAAGCYRIIMEGGSDMEETLKVKVYKDFKGLDQDKSLAKLLLDYLRDIVKECYVVLKVNYVEPSNGSEDYEEEI